jgi:hypothetical protein
MYGCTKIRPGKTFRFNFLGFENLNVLEKRKTIIKMLKTNFLIMNCYFLFLQ